MEWPKWMCTKFAEEIMGKDSYYWVDIFYEGKWKHLFYLGWSGRGLSFTEDPKDSSKEWLLDGNYILKHSDELKCQVPDIADKIYNRS